MTFLKILTSYPVFALSRSDGFLGLAEISNLESRIFEHTELWIHLFPYYYLVIAGFYLTMVDHLILQLLIFKVDRLQILVAKKDICGVTVHQ